jgi:hypothetical protein
VTFCTTRAEVAEFPAGVHANPAAHGSRDPRQAFDAGQALADGTEHELLHVHAGADFDLGLVKAHPAEEFLVEPEHGAIDPGVAHQQVCAKPKHVNRYVVVNAAAGGLLQFFGRSRAHEPPRRAADLVPGVRLERLVLRHGLLEAGEGVGGCA